MEDPVNPFETMLHELMIPLYRVLRLVTLPLLQQPGPDLPLLLSGPGRKTKQPDTKAAMLAKELPYASHMAYPMAGLPIVFLGKEGDVESMITQQWMWGGVLSQQIVAEQALTEILPTQAIRNHEEQPGYYRHMATNSTIIHGAIGLPPIPDWAEAAVADDRTEMQQYPISSERDRRPQKAQNKWPEMIKNIGNNDLQKSVDKARTSSLHNLRIPAWVPLLRPMRHPNMEGGFLLPELSGGTDEKENVRQMSELTDRVMPRKRTDDTYVQNQQGRVIATNPIPHAIPANLTVHVQSRDTGTPNVRQQIEEVLLEIFDTINPR